MNGYDFCKKVIDHKKGGVEFLLKAAGGRECEWLELKASIKLSKEDSNKGESQKDLYWNIAKAVIALANSTGGALIIGIDDNGQRVDLANENNDPRGIIKSDGHEKYYLKEIYGKIWSGEHDGKEWNKEKGIRYTKKLPSIMEYNLCTYEGGEVFVILVKPLMPSLKICEGRAELVYHRSPGKCGKVESIWGVENINNYDNQRCEKKIRRDELRKSYDTLTGKKKSRRYTAAILILFLILFLFFYGVVPKFFAPEIDFPPDMHPEKITVEHPNFTLEGYCLNHKNWWEVVDSVKVGNGIWELQRHDIMGNFHFRILDPRNVMRCWGTKKQVQPIWDNLKPELIKKFPLQEPEKIQKKLMDKSGNEIVLDAKAKAKQIQTKIKDVAENEYRSWMNYFKKNSDAR